MEQWFAEETHEDLPCFEDTRPRISRVCAVRNHGFICVPRTAACLSAPYPTPGEGQHN